MSGAPEISDRNRSCCDETSSTTTIAAVQVIEDWKGTTTVIGRQPSLLTPYSVSIETKLNDAP
jgi:hypothetical protein